MKSSIVAAALACVSCICFAEASLAQERREVPDFRTYGIPPSQVHALSIDRFLMRFKSAWAHQDAEALISLHAADTEWINAYARVFQDRTALMGFLQNDLFLTFLPEVSQAEIARLRPISIRYLGDAAAIVHLYTESNRGVSRNQDEELRRTHIHLVIELQDPDWQIVHTAIMDAR